MAKKSTKYICSACGYETARWMGKCPACGAWNTFDETVAAPEAEIVKKLKRKPGGGTQAVRVDEIPDEGAARLTTGIGELDRVLGGGAVEGSMMLVGGEPGIGKSTLLTQASANMARDGWKVLYVSGEESARQIKMRARRLQLDDSGFMVLSENDMNAIDAQIDEIKPDVLIADSVQTMYLPELSGAPGSVSQVRESAALLMRKAKADNICVFLVGHVTKEGSIAGPRILEHMVDAVLYFEGDGEHQYRLLRAVKNRFGSVNEIGMFEMTGDGMREVPNPSEALLNERAHGQSGSCVNCAMEGTRALLVDVQALVATTAFGNPRRMSSGVDQGRMALLLAVMEKRAGMALYNKDVYVNIAGGMSLSEPAADLAICAAIASGHKNIPLDGRWAVMGEVGLAGEVRAVSHAERRLAECARMGFTDVVLPKGNLRSLSIPEGVRVHGVDTVAQAFYRLFETEVGKMQD
ncbi:MAG: DNA repair protein RadA [Eubacteriales bacterium]|nr:DNA repair protein RadA [Eubacteriales bacterium]